MDNLPTIGELLLQFENVVGKIPYIGKPLLFIGYSTKQIKQKLLTKD